MPKWSATVLPVQISNFLRKLLILAHENQISHRYIKQPPRNGNGCFCCCCDNFKLKLSQDFKSLLLSAPKEYRTNTWHATTDRTCCHTHPPARTYMRTQPNRIISSTHARTHTKTHVHRPFVHALQPKTCARCRQMVKYPTEEHSQQEQSSRVQ